jgi:outer membrane protein assembly factor BamD (BamD/ComL family)
MAFYPDDNRVAAAQKAIVALKAEQVRGSFEVARFYEKSHKWAGAVVYYNVVLQLDANSPLAAQARQRIDVLKPRLRASTE